MTAAKHVVYFAYLGGDEGTEYEVVRRRLSFMENQLSWLARLVEQSGESIEVLMPYVAPRAWDADVHRVASRHGARIDPESVRSDRFNRFEYEGFRALKALAARSAPDTLIYYCHSKGIVQLAESKMGLFRLHTEVGLRASLDRLVQDAALNRAGLFPSRFGWCWYNFFWIKAGYMAGLPVVESLDRYHFEALIGGPRDKEAYRFVLPLIDRLPFEVTGISLKPWYRPEETTSPNLAETYARYARLTSPSPA